jgi:hypothetical protein
MVIPEDWTRINHNHHAAEDRLRTTAGVKTDRDSRLIQYARPVAQIANLLYRRMPFGRPLYNPRLPDWQSAKE